MRKTSLITAILLLSAVWAVAQTSPSSSPQSTAPDASSQQSTSPSSTSPSQQPSTSTTTQTTTTQTTETSSGNSIEGCLSGSAGNWTLTDQSGKTYQLSGDTSKLSDHVGHQIRVMGTDNSSSASNSSSGSMGSSAPSSSSGSSATGAGSSSGSQPTFTVQKVKMISSSCPTGSK
jgi:hypothetical protein